MEEIFVQGGKMGVVVAVIAAIFIGLVIYLVRLDRKISQWEDQNNTKTYG